MNAYLLVGLGGAVGSMARYGVARLVPSAGFPWATLVVNVAGSFLMGMLVVAIAKWATGWSESARLLLGVGLLGGFTTFSAFSLDTMVLAQRGEWLAVLGYVVVSIVASLAAIVLGFWLMRGVA